MEDDAGDGKTVREILLEKHPIAADPLPDTLPDGTGSSAPNPILYERVTPDLIRRVGRDMSGSSGPSGLDADAWRRMLTCYNDSSNRLCSALATAARCLCTEAIDGRDLTAFTAARLIPLNKNPGIRPIAVGEVFRRIICKAVARVVTQDILAVTAPTQLCVGVPSACETAVHTMNRLFSESNAQAVLLVDATNAFNAMNRAVALHNVPIVCPALGGVFRNTYSVPSRLFVAGGGEVSSQEGTSQGDLLAMGIYAVAMMPLVNRLRDACPDITQSWYADDDAAIGTVADLRGYWDCVVALGPGYGYHPNSAKTSLLVKPEWREEACRAFAGTNISIIDGGCRYLGGVLGNDNIFRRSHLSKVIAEWVSQIERLATVARTQPHAAYTVFIRGIVAKWRYTLRAADCPAELLENLDQAIDSHLLPQFTGQQSISATSSVRRLLSLPTRHGGMSIPVISIMAEQEHTASLYITQPFVDLVAPGHAPPTATAAPVSDACAAGAIPPRVAPDVAADATGATVAADSIPSSLPFPAANTPQSSGVPDDDPPTSSMEQQPVPAVATECRRRAREMKSTRTAQDKATLETLKPGLSKPQCFLAEIANEKGVSFWLTATPSTQHGTVLRKSDFRDAVAIRYSLPLLDAALACVCGKDATIDHAMVCPTGGYPSARHNELRDVLAGVMSEVVRDVETEPRLLPLDGESLTGATANRATEARLDIRARGFWTRQQDAFFDVRVTYPKASSQSRSEALGQLRVHERQKKRHYAERINIVERGSFTLLVFSTAGMAGVECSMFLKSLVTLIVEKNIDLPYSVVMSRLRCKLSFCLLRWAITCLRGCRSSYKRNRHSNFIAECRTLSR